MNIEDWAYFFCVMIIFPCILAFGGLVVDYFEMSRYRKAEQYEAARRRWAEMVNQDIRYSRTANGANDLT